MADYREHFALDPQAVWLNTSHQGALPRVAAEAAQEAIEWKKNPQQLTTQRFNSVPARLRRAVAQLLEARVEDVFLSNGSSYGIHLLANGLPLSRGDGVLLMDGDFPSNLLPWLDLRRRGVAIQLAKPTRSVLSPEEVEQALTPNTRVLCLSWVHSFSGWTLDIEAIGDICKTNGTWLILNATQGLGPRLLNVTRTPVDAIVCSGWKWLCGPYATGFGWLRDELRKRLTVNQRYWLSMQTADDLGDPQYDLERPPPDEARRYDVFATANFLNFHAWGAALELLSDIGVSAIAQHDQGLVNQLISGLDRAQFELISPIESGLRSTLLFLTHTDRMRNRPLYEKCAAQGVHIAFRRGHLRVAPHLYNTDKDIEQLLAILNGS